MRIFLLLQLILISSCMGTRVDRTNTHVKVIGHRGHVSQYPENSIEGFQSALAIGVDALEMDLVISGDKEVVISHEPYISSSYMTSPEGKKITPSQEKELLIYQMPYDSIKQFDSGSRRNGNFRNQKRIPTYKPLLKEMFEKTEAYRIEHELKPVDYYLEIKSTPEAYGISQPYPSKFIELVMQVIQDHDMEERVVIMSFDAEILNVLKKKYPEIKVSCLVYRTEIEEGLKKLNFTPEIIGPYYKQLKSPEKVARLQEQGMKVIPWTVNSKRKINRMIKYGVDGIISDYPEKVLASKKAFQD